MQPVSCREQGEKSKTCDPKVTNLVIKLGGSLFDLPEIGQKIVQLADIWAAQFVHGSKQSPNIWLVTGGGRFADEVRRLDSIHKWPSCDSHRLALQTMSLTAFMIAGTNTRFKLVRNLQIPVSDTRANIIRVVEILSLPGIDQIPNTWDMTSDSIAAWMTHQLSDSRLLLAKSTSLPSQQNLAAQAAELGLVDHMFPRFSKDLIAVDWVNLRDPEIRILHWLNQSGTQT